MNKTTIDWADYTWNPVVGCKGPNGTPCPYCYARRFAMRGLGEYGKWPKAEQFKPRFLPERLEEPMRAGKPSLIFAVSMGDMWSAATDHEWAYKVFAVMAVCQWHTFLILTKRPEQMDFDLSDDWFIDHVWEEAEKLSHNDQVWPLPNVWIGTSITNQQDADERIPWLLKTPAAYRWVSIEPLLGPVDLSPYNSAPPMALSWIVVGGQTGPGAVKPQLDWVSGVVDQCRETETPVFLKENLAKVWGPDLPRQLPKGMEARP